jgi:hypothetical protein
MPIMSKPPIPPYGTRRVVIVLKGPKETPVIKRFNKELKKVARKFGATFKKRATAKRAKAKRKR